MQFKNPEEFVKIHDRICLGQTYGGRTWLNTEYRFCKLCKSFYRGKVGGSGKGQLDSKKVKERLERIDEEFHKFWKEEMRKNYEKMGITVEETK